MAIAGDGDVVEAAINYLEKVFKIKKLGNIGTFVGLNCERDRERRLKAVNHHRYTKAILKRFNLDNTRPVAQPIEVSAKFHKASDGEERADPANYQSMIGSIMFLMLGSRPDLAYVCGLLARYSKDPTVAHAKALQRVFRYIQGTQDFRLQLGGNEDLIGFSDSAFADDVDSARSTAGYIYRLGVGAIVSESSLKQDA